MKSALKILFAAVLILSAGTSGAKDLRRVSPGAEDTTAYFHLIRNKRIAIVANQTSLLGGKYLVDSLLHSGFSIKRIFAPEHGFRGEAGAGDHVKDGVDVATGINIVSIYGKHMKPTAEDLEGIDVVIFDIQDVGVRFFTYISTLQYVMEACAENHIRLIVLDRPNPNGYYIDGPVLDRKYASFIGMQPVPVVYGMTMGEYALMLNGEKWLAKKVKCQLKVIPNRLYTHSSRPVLQVRPSPNLPDMDAIYLYPSVCFFEGTRVSLGRGTSYPFRLIGYPGMKDGDTSFTPREIPGVATNPPYEDTLCQGAKLINYGYTIREKGGIHLEWLIRMYKNYPDKSNFFTSFFKSLAGNDELRIQIEQGKIEEEIKASWKSSIDQFKVIRKKYLLYDDFSSDTQKKSK